MFQGRSLLKEVDFTPAEIEYLIDFSIHLKDLKKRNIPHEYLKGQNICLLFEKASTRTRSAFTVAAKDLGAKPELWERMISNLGKKNLLKIQRKFSVACLTGLNSVDSNKKM